MFQTYQTISTSFSVLSMLAYAGGFSACLIHRRLASMLILAAIGFAGLFCVSAVVQVSGLAYTDEYREWMLAADIAAGAFDFVSQVLVVAGLWFSFVEIRRKLALALEATHGRR